MFFKRKTWTKWSLPRQSTSHLCVVQVRYCLETGEFQLKHTKSYAHDLCSISAPQINDAIDELVKDHETESKRQVKNKG